MRLVTYRSGGMELFGALLDTDRILDLQAGNIARLELDGASTAAACEFARAQVPGDALKFIQLGEPAVEAARSVLALAREGRLPATTKLGRPLWYRLEDVELLPPVPRPGKIIAVGLNYSDHAAESGMAIPKNPVLFAKFATSLVAAGRPVVHPGPEVTTRLDYEVELAVVIGRQAYRVTEAEALAHVYGYAVMNDVSARDLQFEDGQWLKGKALDTFAPFGPAIVTADEVADPHNLNLRLTLNGEVMQNSNTRHLIFGVPRLVSYLSQLMTLEPGDVISTGTPAGVGASRKPPRFLQPGDVMVAEVEGIGVLTNRVVAR